MALGNGTPVLSANGLTLTIPITGGTTPYLPATGVTGFSVKANGITVAISSAVVTSTNVVATLATAIDEHAVVKTSYSSGNVVDSAGSPASLAAMVSVTTTNNSTVSSSASLTIASAVLSAAGDVLTITIGGTPTLPLNPGVGLGVPRGFTVKANTVAQTIDDIVVSGSTIVATLSNDLSSGATVTLNYSSGNISDSDGATLHAYQDVTVTNNSTIGPDRVYGVIPEVTSVTNTLTWDAVTNAATYKVYKDGSGTALATVTAPTVTYDDVVTDGLSHYYTIAAVDTNTHIGPLSKIIKFPAPFGLSETVDEGGDPNTIPADDDRIKQGIAHGGGFTS